MHDLFTQLAALDREITRLLAERVAIDAALTAAREQAAAVRVAMQALEAQHVES